MKYRVLWSPFAEMRLENLLQSELERQPLAAAAQEIDQKLIKDPKDFGESRYDTVRVGFVRPLGVEFDVMDDVRTVVVYNVWRIDQI